MATAQMHPRTSRETDPRTAADASTRHGDHDTHGSTRTGHPDRHHPVRTALRGAGVFLDTTWRVVLLGGEGIDGVKR